MTNSSLHTPDILSCLASLSSDEVFTPPRQANEVLDLLPNQIWSDPKTTFLDPGCKSGIFLREITKRLDRGLAESIPDRESRLNHIFTEQLFGLAISELTGMISRRSLYCSRNANGEYSVCDGFSNQQGNVLYRKTNHSWNQERCVYCGANKSVFDRNPDLETHAYRFIHTNQPQRIFGMKFDVILGNPPYQLSDGGDTNEGVRNRGGAVPLYHLFVEQAIKLDPRFITMIIPSRWFTTGRGLDKFRTSMLNDRRLRKLVDFPKSSECFPGVSIKGGVCYFLWDRDNPGLCEVTTIRNGERSSMERPLLETGDDTFIRFNEAVTIVRKVVATNEPSFDRLVSPQKPFGFRTFFRGDASRFANSIELYGRGSTTYVGRGQVSSNDDLVNRHKVFISMAYGAGEDFPHQILNKPFYGKPGSCCTETFLAIGPFNSKRATLNCIRYICSKFFRFLVLLRKNTQHAARGVYSLVPQQDLRVSWNDTKLYEKYGLSPKEIDFVESMVRPMELPDD